VAQGGAQGGPNIAGAMAQSKRIRNKNPNCNHNNNSTFYQPHFNNVKYDDSYKKKEEVLRKVFFKECAKEEEKRANNQMTPGYPPGSRPGQATVKPNTSDPIQHLKIIENALILTLFQDYELSRNHQALIQVLPKPSLMVELGLDSAIVAHKAFLLALIQAGKIVNENMFKVLHEFK
jgi:hypothetical protein